MPSRLADSFAGLGERRFPERTLLLQVFCGFFFPDPCQHPASDLRVSLPDLGNLLSSAALHMHCTPSFPEPADACALCFLGSRGKSSWNALTWKIQNFPATCPEELEASACHFCRTQSDGSSCASPTVNVRVQEAVIPHMRQRSDYNFVSIPDLHVSGTFVVSTWEELQGDNPGANWETMKLHLHGIFWKTGELGCSWQKIGEGLVEP